MKVIQIPAKFDRCVKEVRNSAWWKKHDCNPYAICTASIKKTNSYRVMYRPNKTHRWLYWNIGFLSDKQVRTKHGKIITFRTKTDAERRQTTLKKVWAKDAFKIVKVK